MPYTSTKFETQQNIFLQDFGIIRAQHLEELDHSASYSPHIHVLVALEHNFKAKGCHCQTYARAGITFYNISTSERLVLGPPVTIFLLLHSVLEV